MKLGPREVGRIRASAPAGRAAGGGTILALDRIHRLQPARSAPLRADNDDKNNISVNFMTMSSNKSADLPDNAPVKP